MKVLVTGGAGYIGSHVSYALLDAGHEALIVDNLSTGDQRLVPDNAIFYQGDFASHQILSKIFLEHSIDAIIHLAASIVVSDSIQYPADYYHNNLTNTLSLLNFLVENQCEPSFLFSSTAAVYGKTQESMVLETTNTSPENPYGKSKLMAEKVLQDISSAFGLHYGILRYFNVAGADLSGRTGQILAKPTNIMKRAVQHAVGLLDSFTIYGDDYDTSDGTCIRDYIHVSDLADIHVMMLEYIASGGASGIWNCGYGKGYSVAEVVQTLSRFCDTLNVQIGPRRAGDIPQMVANVDKLMQDVSWVPQHNDLDKILLSALAWERHLLKKDD